MRTLVTGATSGLGRNAVDYLAARQAPLRATGRNLGVGATLRAQGVEFMPVDLSTASASQIDTLLDGIDTIWHCAALSSPWGRLQDFEAANVAATRHLALAAARHGVRRFIHISTPSLYFDYRHRTAVPETFRPVRFANHYANTKARAEDVIRRIAVGHTQTRFVMLRPRAIFGPHDRVLFPRIIHLLRARNGYLPLPRGGATLMDLTYAENVVHAMQLATTRSDLPSGEAFNITNGEPARLRDVLDALLRSLHIPYRIVALPYPLLDAAARAMQTWAAIRGREPALTRYGIGTLQFDMTLDTARAQRLLGYRPTVTLKQGIETTAQWIRSHGDNYGL